ncbi:hypothetical protein EVC27_025 [Rhizobium phage RHph_I1_6]|uniref:Uncharacterized protein n=1 Tax=Rhizobium phage RHph_I1_6 TaxID=2509728 RepID=A0A7S5RFJ4_9CAUD|nr:hypothetical protein PP745_gp025 [Rhizobium phage RHph_I1_6]QIG76550.1 hypothetical protein EVC27_025 [Rhizobium phage RHph_I1_6]
MPSAKKGDVVKCLVSDYSEYEKGDEAFVLGVSQLHIKLANRKSPIGYAWYLSKNWAFVRRGHPAAEDTRRETMAAYEKTKYFVAVLDEEQTTPQFLVLNMDSVGPLRDMKSEAFTDARTRIRADDAGKRLVILQTIALVEEEDPRPPIKITEYK